ncbi:diguanylate cyclase (GGDEF) domain-containing protein [Klenkia soli]|uniref:Diguanylate cyclase (GGDEF) domain-containing protein n=1 Tax=Klenkia soli TaxID=1052260 RepID=A0A1H0P506_9ACTN|nr:diguanylate cyclase (GGDEF) domain-containing protein [Klenkia soli]
MNPLGRALDARRRWWTLRRPHFAPRVTAALLVSGAVLLAVVLVVFPVDAAVAPWVLAAAMLATAVWCRLAPAGSRAAGIAVVTGSLLAVAAVAVSAHLFGGLVQGWPALLGLPVVHASSQLQRRAGRVVTAFSCAAAAWLAVDFAQDGGRMVVDVLLVVGCLLLLAAFTQHTADDQERLAESLERIAGVDVLTGLVTRRVLDDAAVLALAATTTPGGTSLVLLDLDHFKSVNDTHGHPVGDRALQLVAGLLTASVRRSDAVVARLGGDELAVLLRGCTPDTAVARVSALVGAVRRTPLVVPGIGSLPLTVSVGIAHAPTHAEDLRSLYAAADEALYAAKRAGRDGWAVAPAPESRPGAPARPRLGAAGPPPG